MSETPDSAIMPKSNAGIIGLAQLVGGTQSTSERAMLIRSQMKRAKTALVDEAE